MVVHYMIITDVVLTQLSSWGWAQGTSKQYSQWRSH